MIIVDESNLDFSSNLITSLRGRGVECGLFSFESESFSNASEKIYLSFKSKDYDFKGDKELIPFLKSNGFKKAALLVLDSGSFEVEKYLNEAITVMKVPALDGAPNEQVKFFLHVKI